MTPEKHSDLKEKGKKVYFDAVLIISLESFFPPKKLDRISLQGYPLKKSKSESIRFKETLFSELNQVFCLKLPA